VRGGGIGYEPEGGLEVEPDDGAVPEPAGGVPVWLPEPLPMLGQFWVELELEPELEPEEVPEEPELAVPEPVLPEPVLPEPELPVLELDDGAVVDELLAEPVPELPVEVDVVAALATNAPPATRPEVSALVASTLRRRIFIGCLPFHLVRSANPSGPAPHTVRPGSGSDRTME
jgi:hypothetical protein